MIYFTTFFDKNYLSRGLVLFDSLSKLNEQYKLFLLCLDSDVYDFFDQNKNMFSDIVLIKLSELEEEDSLLKGCKSNRSIVEYYFTLSPCLPLFLLNKYNLPHICSLDADIKFYSSPKVIFESLEEYSIIITPHKFSKENFNLVEWGKYNVSFQIFKNNAIGVKCLTKWRSQCIDWCKDVLDTESNRFADQKYLDTWLVDYKGSVKVLNDSTSGIAPWNVGDFQINLENEQFMSNSEPLVFYHFHHLKAISKYWFSTGFHIYNVKVSEGLKHLYRDYLCDVGNKNKFLKQDFSVVVNLRKPDSRNLRVKLLEENQVFLKIRNLNVFFDLKKTNRLLKFFIFKIYAKVNRN